MKKISKNRKERLRKGIILLPNLVTTAAMFAGFYAIIAAIDGNFRNAAIALFVAMFMDGLDGRVARMTSTESDFGKEYDSLSDMVSFGLAPALVVYQWGVVRISEYGVVWGRLGWMAAFIYAVACALRLARFNTRNLATGKRYFQGLPSPSAAALVASMIWLGARMELEGISVLALGLGVTVLAGLLMVSNFSYYSFKDLNLGGRIPFAYVILVPLVFILISLDPPVVLLIMSSVYALSGPTMAGWRFFAKRRQRQLID
ncbi:MAG: CDP-diacylglycerol--serine O-phosphatidyltransferase [Gammaproteobacteria bacterium]|nr:CDP-diacylglycerol--serine O-phosphatidyltransferase [Gammaproteobacteria bacterium]